MARPKTPQESMLRLRFHNPHDVWYNGREGRRIARRRWKRNRSKHLRRLSDAEIRDRVRTPDGVEMEEESTGKVFELPQ